MKRRDFLKSVFRNGIVGLLSIGGLSLAVKKKKAKSNPHICVSKGICQGCSAYSDCILPQAISRRKMDL